MGRKDSPPPCVMNSRQQLQRSKSYEYPDPAQQTRFPCLVMSASATASVASSVVSSPSPSPEPAQYASVRSQTIERGASPIHYVPRCKASVNLHLKGECSLERSFGSRNGLEKSTGSRSGLEKSMGTKSGLEKSMGTRSGLERSLGRTATLGRDYCDTSSLGSPVKTYMESITPRTVKCVLVGDSGVGKTSLLMRYTVSKFNEQHSPTIYDKFSSE